MWFNRERLLGGAPYWKMCSIVYALDLYHMYVYEVYYSKKMRAPILQAIMPWVISVGHVRLISSFYSWAWHWKCQRTIWFWQHTLYLFFIRWFNTFEVFWQCHFLKLETARDYNNSISKNIFDNSVLWKFSAILYLSVLYICWLQYVHTCDSICSACTMYEEL